MGHGDHRDHAWRPVRETFLTTRSASDRTVLDDLRELVAALDRRVPHPERKGESAIAQDSARMKKRAEARIEQLEESDQDAPRSVDPVPISAIIDVSRPRPTRIHRALSLFADLALAILLVLAIPLVLTAMSLPLVWLVRAAAGVVDLF
jgi:hypothetical protein